MNWAVTKGGEILNFQSFVTASDFLFFTKNYGGIIDIFCDILTKKSGEAKRFSS